MRKNARFYINNALIIVALVLAFFGVDFFMEFATDTYVTATAGWNAIALDSICRNGRVTMALTYFMADFLNLSVKQYYTFSYITAIICLTLSVFILQNEIYKIIRNNLKSMLAAILIIINPFVIEYFMFLEKGMFFFAILSAVVASKFYILYLFGKKKRFIVISAIFAIIAAFTYQPAVFLFVCICLPFVFHYRKNLWKTLSNITAICAIWVISVVSNAITLKFVGSGQRLEQNAFSLWELLFNGRHVVLKHTLSILPVSVWQTFLIILFVVTAICIICAKNRIIINFFNLGMMIAITVVGSFSTIIVGIGFFSARIIYPIGTIGGIIYLYCLLNCPVKMQGRLMQVAEKAVTVIIVLFITIQYISFLDIQIDRQKVTELDKYRVTMISQGINEYEKESGNEVSKICIYNDNLTIPQYKGLYHMGNMVESAFTMDWSDITSINYYTGRNFSRGEKDPEIAMLFESNDDTVFCREQMIFKDDTLHLLIY